MVHPPYQMLVWLVFGATNGFEHGLNPKRGSELAQFSAPTDRHRRPRFDSIQPGYAKNGGARKP